MKTAIYVDDQIGIVLETLEDVQVFKKKYFQLFDKNHTRNVQPINAFKDIHVPVSEGQAIIVLIKQYGHHTCFNNATWKHFN
jgi:hypothetical protein